VKIECSHCKKMYPAIQIFDRERTNTICFNCSQKNDHSNAHPCPKCGLKNPEKCDHQFVVNATLSGSAPGEFQWTKCLKCGQKRAHTIPNVKAYQEKPIVEGDGPLPLCMTCEAKGHTRSDSCLKCAELKKSKPPKEDMICPHCGAGFRVSGDIETWDTVYTTCMDCFQKGHRRMPSNCGVCTDQLVGFAKDIADETLRSIRQAEVEENMKCKCNRNIVL